MKLADTFLMDKNLTSQPPLILVVEDNEDNLLLISYILESFGCRLITQNDGESAVTLAKQYRPDLILLDIVLPGISGIDVLYSLRKESLTRDIPAIALTALATEENHENLIRAGFNNTIIKPYLIEELEEAVGFHLSTKVLQF